MKINQDCELNVTIHGKGVIEISTIHDNQFKRKLYLGYTEKQAKDKFKEMLSKGETKA